MLCEFNISEPAPPVTSLPYYMQSLHLSSRFIIIPILIVVIIIVITIIFHIITQVIVIINVIQARIVWIQYMRACSTLDLSALADAGTSVQWLHRCNHITIVIIVIIIAIINIIDIVIIVTITICREQCTTKVGQKCHNFQSQTCRVVPRTVSLIICFFFLHKNGQFYLCFSSSTPLFTFPGSQEWVSRGANKDLYCCWQRGTFSSYMNIWISYIRDIWVTRQWTIRQWQWYVCNEVLFVLLRIRFTQHIW